MITEPRRSDDDRDEPPEPEVAPAASSAVVTAWAVAGLVLGWLCTRSRSGWAVPPRWSRGPSRPRSAARGDRRDHRLAHLADRAGPPRAARAAPGGQPARARPRGRPGGRPGGRWLRRLRRQLDRRRAELAGQRILRSLVAVVAGVMIVVGGLLLERACRVRKAPRALTSNMSSPSVTQATRRRQRSTRVTVAVGLILLAALVSPARLWRLVGSWSPRRRARGALGAAATRITHTELADSRRAAAGDRAARPGLLRPDRAAGHRARGVRHRHRVRSPSASRCSSSSRWPCRPPSAARRRPPARRTPRAAAPPASRSSSSRPRTAPRW